MASADRFNAKHWTTAVPDLKIAFVLVATAVISCTDVFALSGHSILLFFLLDPYRKYGFR